MSTSREIGGATAGLGVRTVRLSITDVPNTSGVGVSTDGFDIPALTNSNCGFPSQFVNLSNGVNTITVPANAAAAFLIPPASNAVAWTVKGVSGDTGLTMNLLGWAFIPTTASSFVITTGGAINGFTIVWC